MSERECVCVCVYIYIYVCVCVFMCVCVFVCGLVRACVNIVYVWARVCVCMCVRVCVTVCMHVCCCPHCLHNADKRMIVAKYLCFSIRCVIVIDGKHLKYCWYHLYALWNTVTLYCLIYHDVQLFQVIMINAKRVDLLITIKLVDVLLICPIQFIFRIFMNRNSHTHTKKLTNNIYRCVRGRDKLFFHIVCKCFVEMDKMQSHCNLMTFAAIYKKALGSGGRAVERRTVNRGDGGSIPPTAVLKLGNFVHPTFTSVIRNRQ